MFYIGWFPFEAFLTGVTVMMLVRGKWFKKIFYSLLSACIGLALVMSSLYNSISMVFNIWSIEVIIIELTDIYRIIIYVNCYMVIRLENLSGLNK